MNRPPGALPLLLGVAGLQAAVLAAAGLPAWRATLWGGHAWTFLPLPWLLGTLAAAVIITLAIGGLPVFPGRWPARLGLGLAAAPVFYLLRDRTHLLGDGRLWLSVLGNQRAYHPHEPLAFGGALLATSGLAKPTPAAVALRMEWWSVGLGSLAVVLMLLLASRLATDSRGRWTAFLLLLGMGILQFGFGYVEAYPAFWAATLLFMVLAVDALESRRSVAWAGLATGLAAAIHGAGFLLLPGFLVVLFARKRSLREIMPAAVAVALPLLVGYAGLPLLLPTDPSTGESGGFNPRSWNRLFREVRLYDHGLGAWMLGQANRWTLVSGAALPLLLAWLLSGRRRSSDPEAAGKRGGELRSRPPVPGSAPVNLFLIVSSVSLALPALLLDTEGSRGAAADWDAYSVAAIPLMALAARLWLRPAGDPGGRRALLAAAAVGLFGSLAFIAVNALPAPAVTRFQALADHVFITPRARSWAYESLAVYHRTRGDMKASSDFYLKSVEHQKTNTRLLSNAASSLVLAKRYRESAGVWRQLTRVEPNNPQAWFSLGAMLEQSGSPDSALSAYREALRIKPDYVEAMNYLARLLIQTPRGRPEAQRLLTRSLEMAPGNPGAAWARSTLQKLQGARGREP